MRGSGSLTRNPAGSNRRGSLAGFARSDAAVYPKHAGSFLFRTKKLCKIYCFFFIRTEDLFLQQRISHRYRRYITMDTITLILIIGLAAQGLAFAALILAGPLYAWNDRWLDRTHRATADEDRE